VIQNLAYALLGIKDLYPCYGILPETSKMWKVQVGYKIGSYEPDLEPDLLEKSMCFSDSLFIPFGIISTKMLSAGPELSRTVILISRYS
jgi:hypothetical protein